MRRSELRYIVSRLTGAHAVVNSYLAYELPFLKHRLEGFFATFTAEFAGQPDREDAHERASRIHELYKEFPSWTDDAVVPKDSLLREFIGGSSYIY